MVQIPQDEKGKTPFKLPAIEVPKDETLGGRWLQVRATPQNVFIDVYSCVICCSSMQCESAACAGGPVHLLRQHGICQSFATQLQVIVIVHMSMIRPNPQCPEEVAHLQTGS